MIEISEVMWQQLVEYIEDMEVKCEQEFYIGRTLEELVDAGEMPDVYWALMELKEDA